MPNFYEKFVKNFKAQTKCCFKNKMTSHSYYKDRLGFDPNEVQCESKSAPRKGSSSTRHHTLTITRQHDQHHQQQHHHHSATPSHHSSASPARISISPGSASLDHNINADTTPAKKAKHSSTLQMPQGGYEDALTQFKGTMSIWEYFIENWDILRKWSVGYKLPFR